MLLGMKTYSINPAVLSTKDHIHVDITGVGVS